MKRLILTSALFGALSGIFPIQHANAAIALDRTRIIYPGSEKSLSLNVSNQNKQLPYLAQGWLEDERGNKIQTPLVILPPVQRIEPGAKSQVKIQGLPAANLLAQDRESLFYFNLREIPPRSNKPNTLQIALQTRIKLFYRPAILMKGNSPDTQFQEQLTLIRTGDSYEVNNPTPYYITIIDGSASMKGASVAAFSPVMVEPKGKGMLKASASALGNNPVLTYINDYGGRPKLQFTCTSNVCKASSVKEGTDNKG